MSSNRQTRSNGKSTAAAAKKTPAKKNGPTASSGTGTKQKSNASEPQTVNIGGVQFTAAQLQKLAKHFQAEQEKSQQSEGVLVESQLLENSLLIFCWQ